MCGLAGFWLPQPTVEHGGLLAACQRMTDSIAHRGPDADGLWADSAHGVALGHRRLAILDLSPAGAQPMHSASNRFVLVFNGEIYNYLELRAQLIDGGVRFRGHSDTEVLLAGFEAWGVADTIRRAHGMFAVAVWDQTSRQLTLARDRLGEKPLYVGFGTGGVVFRKTAKAQIG